MKELFKELEKVKNELEITKQALKDIYKLAYNLYEKMEAKNNEN